MKFEDQESGQVLVITAFCMIGLIGFLALAVDVGILYRTRWQMQTAADAAATAAAVEYIHNVNSSDGSYDQASAITAGTNAAAANNPSDGNTMTATVTVNENANSPASHQGCSGSTCFFEAVVSKPNPTIFYRTFFSLWKNSDGGAFTVAARAVAGTPGVSQGCGYLTAPTGSSLTVQGKWSIDASSCGLYINSSSSSVEDDTGKAAKSGVKAQYVELVGPLPNNVTIAKGSNAVVSQVLPQTIPFSNVTAPTPAGCVAKANLTGSVPSGCYSGSVTIGNATLSGLYVFTGDVTINGAVTGTGVTLDINQGTLTIKPGNSTVNLSAPTSGQYNGIVIYQPFANKNTLGLQAGSTTGNLTGFIYAPGATLAMQDNGGGLSVGGLVVNDINNGPASLTITGYTPTTSPLKVVALVE